MPAATIQQFFGATATLANTVLTIDLDDFVGVGLTPTSTSAAEIFTAILLRIKANTPTTAIDDPLWGVIVGDPFLSIVRDNSQLDTQFPVSVYKPFNGSALDPDEVVG
ncbi:MULTISPECIES: hypothetical protein [Cyanophyceae]|uniref:hypothetical protein n=1 Tax=Cyanophyceae TaxID=3028117 RepID=UPI001684CB68|nr:MULTISPECIES: hypothetical protein [Cyanophyceae]MBD1917450.1 hypothetical protein [Phormidium sp. FACHB-77]MBD2032305.1 hypothetical protein [Phormidium sp. FACHB-322]MBD2052243.1 hypothetical protein [Leptolyngbya sp. FACHB-60]